MNFVLEYEFSCLFILFSYMLGIVVDVYAMYVIDYIYIYRSMRPVKTFEMLMTYQPSPVYIYIIFIIRLSGFTWQVWAWRPIPGSCASATWPPMPTASSAPWRLSSSCSSSCALRALRGQVL